MGSSRFQLGEGPSRGLLRDYEPSDGPSFQALLGDHGAGGHPRTGPLSRVINDQVMMLPPVNVASK